MINKNKKSITLLVDEKVYLMTKAVAALRGDKIQRLFGVMVENKMKEYNKENQNLLHGEIE